MLMSLQKIADTNHVKSILHGGIYNLLCGTNKT